MDSVSSRLAGRFSPEALAALPAPSRVEVGDDTVEWRLPDGTVHRLDGPAMEGTDGFCRWYACGELHRLDGPAVEEVDGSREWWVAGLRHRVGGPADERSFGDVAWYVDGQVHRLDGPAIEILGRQRGWFVHGRFHRTDGPALEWEDGNCRWFLDGQESKWVLPAALWQVSATREALRSLTDAAQQRTEALRLLPTLPLEVREAAIAEALASRDDELRLWGLRAAAPLATESPAASPEPSGTRIAPSVARTRARRPR